ncbi:bifunctional tRNA (5-methylaminomethyl-2-thiouridine)(34)-methyltransferase MnmD/FAD-dependent 5-carboxymethylaminomethyl-2-thiouridine(34) oxidoreductase MnmC [Oceanimonas doudoroffii]|uniref:tRNA 5-methylaminomethyl-2-thiouridine biosynthesis bifunctional protein MnmC n=1 Tax=Oceanimonas doudoroffii TaxID=84158 RepID=A0A233RF98_9GAMM|nr:bifunctional tRNA (5-methylaminomethyl-2-thiouridine)(34)-methyltransferase MnmD/FAD-dependent 5-carboxymethylaminomethyl-2-thiouridine(34) oxidoreductase MnmC [Oceanimonas doudoroffii]OXY82057.1 bifunctional tRNA (5-methylaminomethyl-2-thiouridine)(34)-methyltransferase MnmD/FAD-dependent 5-carboxymethylaminomethyl-2-thiouridine(34) oxidoreductase MnmC [Oceanimonas doudoroffii]
MSHRFITTARLDWNDQGTPVATAFDDVYFSNDNGLAETRYVFLGHNGLPQRFAEHDRDLFVVAETGFGTGLNFLATWRAFADYKRQHPQGNTRRLHFISVEKYPLSRDDLQQALRQWPELTILSEHLLAEYPVLVDGCHRLWLAEDVCLDLWLGDVAELLPQMDAGLAGRVDAWYLDGFAPGKNPEMWTPELFAQLARLARNGATLATFTAAGFVRRGLIDAGFEVKRVKGFGRKREMLAGFRRSDTRPPRPSPWYWRRPGLGQRTLIVGAGVAGAALARQLTRRGHHVTLLERESASAQGASGNHQGAIYPLLNGDHDTLSQFYLPAFLYGRRTLERLARRQPFGHDWCGVVQLAHDDKSAAKIDKLIAGAFPPELVRPLSAEEVNETTGIEANRRGVAYPLGGWVCPHELTAALLAEAGDIACHFNTRVTGLERIHDGWQVQTEHGQTFGADNVVLANGHALTTLAQTQGLALYPVRGQVNHLPAQPVLAALNTVVCYEGYLTPAWQGQHCVGASYDRRDAGLDYRETDEADNLAKLQRTLPALGEPNAIPGEGRVGIRAACRDHLPLAGAAPDKDAQLADYTDMPKRAGQAFPLAADHAGLYVLSGLGSRGMCSAPLLAEVLAAQIQDEPLPLGREVLDALNPNRHWLRKLLKGKPVT